MFKKVSLEVAGGFVMVTLFNADTKEVKKITVDDYEYQSNIQYQIAKEQGYTTEELWELRVAEVDAEAVNEYLNFLGVVRVGSIVEVFKGRKIAKGTISKVVNIYDWKDSYGRTQTTYAVLETGEKTNINNLRLA